MRFICQSANIAASVLCALGTAVVVMGMWPGGLSHADSAPGLRAEIIEARIGEGRRAVATIKLSNGNGSALDLTDLDAGSVKFTIAAIVKANNGETAYHNYVLSRVAGREFAYKGEIRQPAIVETLQPGVDRGGAFRQVRPGFFTYTFKAALPANYDKQVTYVIGAELTRENGRYVANPLFEFVPNGGKVKVQRSVVETATCNNCHDPLKYHEGSRREAGYCALCHTSQLRDPESGESLEFKVFVHRIHRGKLLPSVRAGRPFFLVGAGQRVAEYSALRYPQVVMTEGTAKDLRNCNACHAGAKYATWKNRPSATACTSCHNDVDVATGKNHPAGPQADGTCFGCHQPEGTEFGPSIAGAHTFPGRSAQLPGIVFEILNIENTKPGQNLTVTFSVRNKHGEAINAAQMDNLRLVVAWPTIDYKVSTEEDVRKAEPKGDGVYTYRFKYVLPLKATGSGAVGIQGFKRAEVKKSNGSVIKDVRDVGYNLVKYFPITDNEAVPRRQTVEIANCSVCHAMLATHGEARRNTEFCVMCHHAGQTDEEKRKAANGPLPAANVHFKRLIHRIHTGAAAGESFIVYGGTPAKPGPVELGDIRFPGDRRNCLKCHVPGANEPPLPSGLLPTLVPLADGSTQTIQPITSACIACHTKEPAKVHVDTMTASNGQEACVTCHGAGRSFAVEKVHRR
jgi:OmcA/MtrC family decaheme c-type cytochrome